MLQLLNPVQVRENGIVFVFSKIVLFSFPLPLHRDGGLATKAKKVSDEWQDLYFEGLPPPPSQVGTSKSGPFHPFFSPL